MMGTFRTRSRGRFAPTAGLALSAFLALAAPLARADLPIERAPINYSTAPGQRPGGEAPGADRSGRGDPLPFDEDGKGYLRRSWMSLEDLAEVAGAGLLQDELPAHEDLAGDALGHSISTTTPMSVGPGRRVPARWRRSTRSSGRRFYLLEQAPAEKAEIPRRRIPACSCHASSPDAGRARPPGRGPSSRTATGHAGLQRRVVPDRPDEPDGARWGGWYVTGHATATSGTWGTSWSADARPPTNSTPRPGRTGATSPA